MPRIRWHFHLKVRRVYELITRQYEVVNILEHEVVMDDYIRAVVVCEESILKYGSGQSRRVFLSCCQYSKGPCVRDKGKIDSTRSACVKQITTSTSCGHCHSPYKQRPKSPFEDHAGPA